MADVASLVVKVTEQGAKATSDRLDNLSKSAKVAGAAVTGLAAVVAATAYKAAQELVESQRQLDKMSASLKTLTGSTQGAKQALSILQDFARDTPYGLEQAVEGFRKLVALGLTPSEEALRSYGNTASAMGKDLSQMIEAVADASTFEFERLKEFGIKAKQNQKDIEFTFQGTTTVVKKNAADIEQYLLNIGNVNFAGAMADQAGLANIGKIRSAREQGGNLAAGQMSTIAERGKPEVIMPASASRVRTAEQMRQIMGENGAKSGGDNVTIVNNTTGRIDSAATERDDEGRLRIIISETVSSALQDSNSAISKARRATRGQPGH
ncbi:tail length tape-measure protein 1 [Salmonella phage SE40]|nr:tail length tape-measure protein 1 [Salmonella phage SE40]